MSDREREATGASSASSEHRSISSNLDNSKDDAEKRLEDDVFQRNGLGQDDEIDWRYLTFQTDLPSLAHLSQPPGSLTNDGPSPPPCPDLKKYISPFLWSSRRKNLMTWLSVTATACTAYVAGSYTSGIGQVTQEWHVSDVAAAVGITTFTCGFAIAPMFLAPFSEINGRRPVFVATGLLFVIFQLVCALTPTYAGMLVARFLAGCASSTFSTMVGGVVADIYQAEDRNFAMATFTGAALLGTGLGPLVSGPIASHATWRWIFYLQVIMDSVLMIFVVFFFKETRGSVLLSRKAKALNRWYDELEAAGYYGVTFPTVDHQTQAQRIRWKVQADEERGSILQMITVSLYRPFNMLISEPVVFFFSLWVAFSWAVLYMTFTAIPLIFERTYHFNLEQTDAVFAAISVAGIIGSVVAIYQEKLALRYFPQHKELLGSPEGRLLFACVESALLPIGCLWFCITGAYSNIHWIVPTLGVGCATLGIFSIYLAVFNYLADSYHRYASSALAAQSFCRNMLGGAFPLFTRQMFLKMTFQGAGGFLGGIGLLLTIVPWVLLIYGPKIRANSRLASEVMGKDQ